VLVETSEEKKPFGRYGCRWEDIISICIKEIHCEGVNVIQVVWDKIQ
jgi:hypothetical protein